MVKRHMSDDYRDEFFADYRKTLKYKKLSTKEELDFIKKTKLSFYDDVPSEEKDKYLEYYMEMFPKFKEEYLNNPDEKLLDLAIENSKNWRDRFLENTQAMVLKIAFGYLKNCHFLSIVDLISEGNIGMLIALRKFDVEMGNRFSTYAALWIKRYIGDVILRDDKTIRMSNHQQANLAKLNRVERQLYFSLERVPTIEELAEHSGLSINQVEMLREYYINKRVPESLDMPFTEEAEETIGDFVVSLEDNFTNQVENNILFSEFNL